MRKEDYIRMCLVEAMKANDKENKETLAMLLSALQHAEMEKGRQLTPDEENQVVGQELMKINR